MIRLIYISSKENQDMYNKLYSRLTTYKDSNKLEMSNPIITCRVEFPITFPVKQIFSIVNIDYHN